MAIAGNGNIVVAGQSANSVLTYGTVWAFNASGGLDTSFGSGGAAVFQASAGQNSEFGGVAVSPAGGNVVAAGDASSVGGSGYSGLAVNYVGYGGSPPPPPPPATALKLTLSRLSANYKGATLKFSAACNEGCSLHAALGASGGTAKELKLQTRVKRCKKVHGKTKCKTSKVYRALTLASGKATLRNAGTKTFTLRLSKADAKALHKHKSVKLTLTVTASASHKTAKVTKTIKFKK